MLREKNKATHDIVLSLGHKTGSSWLKGAIYHIYKT